MDGSPADVEELAAVNNEQAKQRTKLDALRFGDRMGLQTSRS
jgi:hypothetical protein